MPIHTVRTDSIRYIRVTFAYNRRTPDKDYRREYIPIGAVGKVLAHAPPRGQRTQEYIIADIINFGERIFNAEHVEFITEKEYFIGALSGR